jgi:hypothetical protein
VPRLFVHKEDIMQDLLLKANVGGVRLIVAARYSMSDTYTDGVRGLRHLTIDRVTVADRDADIGDLIATDTLESLEVAARAVAARRVRREVAYV